MGGDEFILVFENVNGKEDFAILAEKVAQVFSQPFDLAGELVMANASIGISLYPQDGTDADTLFKRADKAMYIAKASGKPYHSSTESKQA